MHACMHSFIQSINPSILPSPLSHVFSHSLFIQSINQSIIPSPLSHVFSHSLNHSCAGSFLLLIAIISWKSQQSFGSVVDAPHNLKLSLFVHLTEIPIHHRFPIIIALFRNFRLGTAGHRWYLKHTWTMFHVAELQQLLWESGILAAWVLQRQGTDLRVFPDTNNWSLQALAKTNLSLIIRITSIFIHFIGIYRYWDKHIGININTNLNVNIQLHRCTVTVQKNHLARILKVKLQFRCCGGSLSCLECGQRKWSLWATNEPWCSLDQIMAGWLCFLWF